MMKLAFIGTCGHVYNVYDAIESRDDVVICGLAKGSNLEDIDPFYAFLQKKGHACAKYDDYIRLLDTEKPDIAVVSTLFALCAPISMECLRRGIHVISEKPVASTLEELERLEAEAKTSPAVFSAMHFLRYTPVFYQASELIKQGAIGQPKLITAQKSYKMGTRPEWYRDRSLYGGTIPWVGIHAIDWVYSYAMLGTGKAPVLEEVSAQQFGNPELAALCQFRFAGDLIASVNMDFYRPAGAPTHGDDRCRVVGTEGIVEVQKGTVILTTKDGEYQITPADTPDLTTEFIRKIKGEENLCIPAEEIFAITRLALLARDAADHR